LLNDESRTAEQEFSAGCLYMQMLEKIGTEIMMCPFAQSLFITET
jgi:hypothetical protein